MSPKRRYSQRPFSKRTFFGDTQIFQLYVSHISLTLSNARPRHIIYISRLSIRTWQQQMKVPARGWLRQKSDLVHTDLEI